MEAFFVKSLIYLQPLGLIGGIVGLFLLVRQLISAAKAQQSQQQTIEAMLAQLLEEQKANKIQTISFVNQVVDATGRESLMAIEKFAMEKLDGDLSKLSSKFPADMSEKEQEIFGSLVQYLNGLEQVAALANKGILDIELLKTTFKSRFSSAETKYGLFIKGYIEKSGQHSAWQQIKLLNAKLAQ